MQNQCEDLAETINYTANNTEVNDNTLLSAYGRTIAISVSNGATLDITSKDLTIDITGVSLATNPTAALTFVRNAVTETSAYRGYLSGEVSRLERTIDLLEFEVIQAMGYSTTISNTDLASEITYQVMGQVMAEALVALRTQSNVTPNSALPLLTEWHSYGSTSGTYF